MKANFKKFLEDHKLNKEWEKELKKNKKVKVGAMPTQEDIASLHKKINHDRKVIHARIDGLARIVQGQSGNLLDRVKKLEGINEGEKIEQFLKSNMNKNNDIEKLETLKTDIYALFRKIDKINVRTFSLVQIKCSLFECVSLIKKTIKILEAK